MRKIRQADRAVSNLASWISLKMPEGARIGDLFDLTFDADATAQVTDNTDEFDFGTWTGQLRLIDGDVATFFMVDDSINLTWVTKLNLATGRTAQNVVVTSIEPSSMSLRRFDPSGDYEAASYQDAENDDLEQITAIVKQTLETMGRSVRTLEVRNPETKAPKVKIPLCHEDMPELLYYLSKGDHVYLYGPPGSGKSTAGYQAAQALKATFGYLSLNPQTPESRLFGFIDAMGKYRSTMFRQIYEKGGVMMIDEVALGSPALLASLNTAIENTCCAFPDGMVKRHAQFKLVVADNTNGRGGNPMFPTRQALDAAFLDRFTYMLMGYDRSLEMQVAKAINPSADSWVEWIWAVREYCAREYPRLFVTPRATFKGAKYLADTVLTIDKVVSAVLFKGFDPDSVTRILRNNPLPEVKIAPAPAPAKKGTRNARV